ncbi:MAG: MBL fold metallo-hydrolase [Clostridia bacterium]|nr:MBL fold metallo-hydrolase [Clostridia bacterium]
MEITWLGQAGLLIKEGNACIMIDPYLSDSVAEINPKNKRRVPVDPRFFSEKPTVMVFTHNHLDHYDPETVQLFLTDQTNITVLAPASVWQEVRKIGGDNNYVLFNRGTSWTEGNLRFTAVAAEHSDPDAIGVILDNGQKTCYITGDTLYNEKIFDTLPDKIDLLFLPINGVGNNMNATDATRFCQRICPSVAIPLHFGLFDDLDPETFSYEPKVIPKIYQKIEVE